MPPMCRPGLLLDRIGSTIRNALLLCAGSMVLGSALVALSFGVAGQLWQFIPLFGAGQFAWFAMQVRTLFSSPQQLLYFAFPIYDALSPECGRGQVKCCSLGPLSASWLAAQVRAVKLKAESA